MAKQALTIFLSFLLFLSLQNANCATLATTPAEAPSKPEPETPAVKPKKPAPKEEAPPAAKTLPAATAPAKSPTATPALPAAEPPSEVPLIQAPPHRALTAPTNVSKILEKAGSYSVFIRLLKSTSVAIQIENQLNVSNTLTIFAPTNGAFSGLKPGTLNALSAEQKVQLVQYHILPTYVSFQNFQTLSNPVRTQASSVSDYPMNVIVDGNWVNISTGIVNTSISTTIYDDNQLAVYRVDKVLLPLGIFAPKPKQISPAPAPPLKPAKGGNSSAAVGSGSGLGSGSGSGSAMESDSPVSSEDAHADHDASGARGNNNYAVDFAGVFVVVVVSHVLGQFY